MVQFIKLEKAADIITDDDVVAVSGFAGLSVPEAVLEKIEDKFLHIKKPENLTLMFAAAQGDGKDRGLNHLAHEGLVSKVIGGHFNLAPKLAQLMIEEKIEGYNLPQGIMCNIFRDIARQSELTISKVGIGTFVDPRIEGGKVNSKSKEDLVKVTNIEGIENLIYEHKNINIALIKASFSDRNGNISFEKEATLSEAFVIAQAAKSCNGKVIVQVDEVKDEINLSNIKIPGIYVDYVVEGNEKFDGQALGCRYNPMLCSNKKNNEIIYEKENSLVSERTIIGRRGIYEYNKGNIINIGIGMPEEISKEAEKAGKINDAILTVEPGAIGGIPQGGGLFGSSIYPECIITETEQFDFYDGGGLDVSFLGMAECDRYGNVNVSKFGNRLAGCGGFINITQNSKKIVFCGSFTTRGLDVSVKDDKLIIHREGQYKKFVSKVNQITFNGQRAVSNGQKVLYITERAVFELRKNGLVLIEVAPGIDLYQDVVNLMEFKPIIDENLSVMNRNIFKN